MLMLSRRSLSASPHTSVAAPAVSLTKTINTLGEAYLHTLGGLAPNHSIENGSHPVSL